MQGGSVAGNIHYTSDTKTVKSKKSKAAEFSKFSMNE